MTKHLLEITVTNQDEAATSQYASNEPVPMKRFSQNMKSYLAKAATFMLINIIANRLFIKSIAV